MNGAPLRLVAVGDSVSEGVGDPRRGGLHGWVRQLAEHPELALAGNLARTGARVADVRARQVGRVVALAPDVVTCTVGVNDVLRRGFDAAAFARDHDHVVGALTAAARRGVLVMTLHDIGAGLPFPTVALAGLRRRIATANAVIEQVCREHGAWVLDARAAPPLGPARMLSVDRLHPNRRGHAYIAGAALDVLRAHGAVGPGEPAGPGPVGPFTERLAAAVRHVSWLVSAGSIRPPGRARLRRGRPAPTRGR
ncbi:hypothetical protein BJF78_05705 [Pseudonocardia sp. CNS-139]|nr:hypothetical protein BJF78_05705 [Pseudonocardia sp. CNS-139]